MEVISIALLVICSFFWALALHFKAKADFAAMVFDVKADLEGIKRSTHQVVTIPNEQLTKLEKKFGKVMGQTNEDFDSDLAIHGFNGMEAPEDTV